LSPLGTSRTNEEASEGKKCQSNIARDELVEVVSFHGRDAAARLPRRDLAAGRWGGTPRSRRRWYAVKETTVAEGLAKRLF
jgi:hypothetical protein